MRDLTPSVERDDFEREDGSMDYQGYNEARKANGEKCYRCHCFIAFWHTGHLTLCGACRALDEDRGEVSHDNLIRCPKCGATREAHDGDSYDLLEDGEHDVCCHEEDCEHEFEISTAVSWSFRSPARIAEAGSKRLYPGAPCEHCGGNGSGHVTHPCEKCGRQRK